LLKNELGAIGPGKRPPLLDFAPRRRARKKPRVWNRGYLLIVEVGAGLTSGQQI
jgi:hypothetical protein